MEYTQDTLQDAVKSHVGEHYAVLGDSGCMDWYPEIDSNGNLTGEIVPADDCRGHKITDDGIAAMVMNAQQDQWFIGECPGSDDVYAWGTYDEANRWAKLTGQGLARYDGPMTDEQLSAHGTSFNLQDEINALCPIDCPHCGSSIADELSSCPACGKDLS